MFPLKKFITSIKIANYAPCALGAHPPPTLILLGRQGSPLVPPTPQVLSITEQQHTIW